MVTIDEALMVLSKAKVKIGGDACLILTLWYDGLDDIGDSAIPDANVDAIEIVNMGESRYVEVRTKHPYFANFAHNFSSTPRKKAKR